MHRMRLGKGSISHHILPAHICTATTRVNTSQQPSMDDDIKQKLNCDNEKTTQMGHDMVCNEVTEWKVPFGSTSVPGRCPKCEEDRLYPGLLHILT